MEDTISLILHGIKLVKDLEPSLPDLATHPDMLSTSLDEIINILSVAKQRLLLQDPASHPHMFHRDRPHELMQMDPSLQKWLIRCGVTQAVDAIQAQLLAAQSPFNVGETSRKDSDREEVQGVVASDSGRASSSQRPRRRQDYEERRTLRVAAPRMGNTEVPPEDNYTWRKYGQKEILGSRFPRAYYRCTHQKLYNCPAKKQVQRLDHDPHTFLVTYRGNHTCHISATAPSIAPPQQALEITQEMTQTVTSQPMLITPRRWLSMELSSGPKGGASSSSLAGPSTDRYGKEVDYPLIVDMADAMFNSGSSSGNSMDFIFPSDQEDKWEPGDKKN